MNHIIQQIEAERATRKVPEFRPGDTIVVNVKGEGRRPRACAGL
jgi:large subunit ribosomal protein L19